MYVLVNQPWLLGMTVNELQGLNFTSTPDDVQAFATGMNDVTACRLSIVGREFIVALDMDPDSKVWLCISPITSLTCAQWRNLFILIAFLVFFRLVTYLGLTYSQHGSR